MVICGWSRCQFDGARVEHRGSDDGIVGTITDDARRSQQRDGSVSLWTIDQGVIRFTWVSVTHARVHKRTQAYLQIDGPVFSGDGDTTSTAQVVTPSFRFGREMIPHTEMVN